MKFKKGQLVILNSSHSMHHTKMWTGTMPDILRIVDIADDLCICVSASTDSTKDGCISNRENSKVFHHTTLSAFNGTLEKEIEALTNRICRLHMFMRQQSLKPNPANV